MTSAFIRLSLSLSVGTAMLARRPRLKLSITLIPPAPLPPPAWALAPAAMAAAAAEGGLLALYRLTLSVETGDERDSSSCQKILSFTLKSLFYPRTLTRVRGSEFINH